MSMNRKATVREVGRRKRPRSADVQRVLETMIEVWIEELAKGCRVEIEGFVVMEKGTDYRRKVKVRISGALLRRVSRD